MLAINKIITAVLVFLVVASVLMFLFKSDIISYIKNLPGYGEGEGKDVDIIKDEETPAACVMVGRIGEGEKRTVFSQQYIYLYDEDMNPTIRTSLYITQNKKKIVLDKSWKDKVVAKVVSGKIALQDDVWLKYKDLLEPIDYFKKLEGTRLDGNFICE